MTDTGMGTESDDFVRWPEEFARAYVARGYWRGRPLGSMLAESARARPDTVCLVDGTVRITYRELIARADGAAMRLRGLGVGPGDRIAVQLPNCWEHVVLTIACLRLGAPAVWVNPRYGVRELSAVIARTGARAVAVADRLRGTAPQEVARGAAEACGDLEHILVTGPDVDPGNLPLREVCAPGEGPRGAGPDASPPDAHGVAILKLSGGTTGALPKIVPRTHDDLAYMTTRAGELCGFDERTIYLAVLPLAHGFPNTGPGVLGTLLSGGRVVLSPSPSPEVALELIERERVTVTSVVPAILTRWLRYRASSSRTDTGSLELLQVGAARLEPSVARRVRSELGCALQQVFGMSEGLLCLTRLDDPEDVVLHTQGRPICSDDEIRVLGPTGEAVPTGTPGALLTRGPYTPRGYYRSPELDARHYTADGWYRTGDLVRMSPDGNLTVVGREKDVVNRGGEKINAEEVEEMTLTIEGVREAAVVAAPDMEMGERVCLFVVAHPDHAVELGRVRDALASLGLAPFKLPEQLLTVDALPRTDLGKTDKPALRVLAAQAKRAGKSPG